MPDQKKNDDHVNRLVTKYANRLGQQLGKRLDQLSTQLIEKKKLRNRSEVVQFLVSMNRDLGIALCSAYLAFFYGVDERVGDDIAEKFIGHLHATTDQILKTSQDKFESIRVKLEKESNDPQTHEDRTRGVPQEAPPVDG